MWLLPIGTADSNSVEMIEMLLFVNGAVALNKKFPEFSRTEFGELGGFIQYL